MLLAPRLVGTTRRTLLRAWERVSHAIGAYSERYYFEDFVRVYPDGIAFNRLGLKRAASKFQLNNFLNHRKFYLFAAQFARGRMVADIGCGSGYGCAILHAAGASSVVGADLSKHAVAFAQEHYGAVADFSIQGITCLGSYPNGAFEAVVSSEVLEHVKDYGAEELALAELKRIACAGAVVVIGTPNSELLSDHGFSYEEIDGLVRRHFTHYCIFENALVPFGESKAAWRQRVANRQTGVVVTQAINLRETALSAGDEPEIKVGIPPGLYPLGELQIDTRLLHNTHSWIVVAIRD